MHHRKLTALAAATASLALVGTATAAAAPETPTRTLAEGLVSPLRAAVDADGTAYVTQDFMGQLMRIEPGEKPEAIYQTRTKGAEVGAVSVRRGVVTFAESVTNKDGAYVSTKIKRIDRSGKVSTVTDLVKFEKKKNPDGKVTYGVAGLAPECAAQWPTDKAGPPSYPGIKDSHPYATVTNSRGKTYVADAAMNAVVSVSASGKVRTVGVLPPTMVPITAELAKGFGIPECAVGKTYAFESVPTDVELGPDGKLYVTTLGGAAGEALPVGAVYKVNPKSGKAKRVVTGLMGATGVAVAPNRDLYVAQLFGGSIVKVKRGSTKPKVFAEAAMPAEVEVVGGKVYATLNALAKKPKGELVVFE